MTTDIIVGFPGESSTEFDETMTLLEEVQFDAVFSFKYSPRPNTPAMAMENAISEEEKTDRLAMLNGRQREIQRANYARHVGQVLEVMVEGYQPARDQVTGRTSQNKTLNFTVPDGYDGAEGWRLCAGSGGMRASKQFGGRNGVVSAKRRGRKQSTCISVTAVRGRIAWKSKCEFVD